MLKRKIDSYLDNFLARSKKALLLTGARQTGKSFSIRQFGKTHFRHFVEINFINQPEAADALKGAKNSQDILVRLSLLNRYTFGEGPDPCLFRRGARMPRDSDSHKISCG